MESEQLKKKTKQLKETGETPDKSKKVASDVRAGTSNVMQIDPAFLEKIHQASVSFGRFILKNSV